MAIGATRKVHAELSRLDSAAEGAGCALACTHQSAEEFHRALVREYLSLHPPRNPLVYTTVVLILASILVFV